MATPQQNIVITVVPAGAAGTPPTKRRFSLHIAPRLTGADTLASFPDFINWAAIARKTAATVSLRRLGLGPSYALLGNVDAYRISVDPDPSLWERIFSRPDEVAVEPFSTTAFGARFKKSTFHSYPTMAMHDFHAKFLTELSIFNETAAPTPAALGTSLGSLTRINVADDAKRVNGQIAAAFNKGDNADWSRVLPAGSARPRAGTPDEVLADHLQLVRFLQPRTDAEFIKNNRNEAPKLDFHRVISMLADHPWLQRFLGLVMDYEIEAVAVAEAGSFSNTSFLQCEPAVWEKVEGTKAYPRTRLETKTFRAKAKGNSVVTSTGVAPLSTAYTKTTGVGWAVTSLDVEGTASKAIGLSDTVQRNLTDPSLPGNKPTTIDVPAPRSGGLSLVRAGRAVDVVAAFKRSAELLDGTAPGASVPTPASAVAPMAPAPPSGDGVELFAEDLIRGWRVDVFDTKTASWRSLTKRDVNYRFSAQRGLSLDLEVEDSKVMGSAAGEPRLFLNEGVISLGVTASADPTKTAADTFVQESVLEWTGWSLVAPRPGRTLSADKNEPTSQATPYNELLDLEISTKPTPKSLPRLRYGRRYRFRLRSSNLAGNGPSLEELGNRPTDGASSREAAYSRFEPVPPPALVQTEPLDTGEALRTLVIKSLDEFALPSVAGTSERHLLAPGASAHTVELHGMLDAMLPNDAYNLVSAREGLQLTPTPPMWMVMMPYTPYLKADVDPGSGDPDVGGALTYYVDGVLPQPPWLVDPAAPGIVLSGPEMGTKSLGYRQGPLGWADPMSSRVIFRGLGVNVPSKLSVVAGGAYSNRFVVEVAKGEQFTIRMSSTVAPALADHFGIAQLMRDRFPATPALPARLGRLKKGLNRVVSPPTYLTVVHAARRPLVEPRVINETASAVRQVGDTFALFGGRVACHPQSTSRLDFNLSWGEWVDRPGDYVDDPLTANPDDTTDRPRRVSGEGQTQPLQVEYPPPGVRPTAISAAKLRHDFGDTKHRHVRIVLTGTSRYAKYFTEEADLVASYTNVFGTAAIQPFSERIVEKTSGAVLQRGRDYTIDNVAHRFTLTTAGASAYYLRTLNVSWVPATVMRDTEEINGQYVHVKSSARPAAPAVSDVFPLFIDGDWAAAGKGVLAFGQKRTRNGQALRVYLDRPWYSSGDNEMLAVVLHRVSGKLTKSYAGGVAEPTMVTPPPGGPIGNVPKSLPQQYTTAWGRDPLVLGQPTPAKLTAGNFPLAAMAPLFGKWATGLKLPGVSTPIVVVPHNVEYDEERKLWYSDIQIDLGAAYRPFVRLALARFQPYSLDGCHLSTIALLDSAQLSPTRTLQVFGVGPLRTVTLSGPMYSGGLTGVPRPPLIGPNAPAELRKGPLIQVSVQERDAAYIPLDDSENIGWEDIVDEGTGTRRYTLTPASGNVPNGMGKYAVAGVNVAPTVVGRQVRLLVREFERDSRTLDEILDAQDGDPYRKRLAWADSYLVS